MVAVDVKNVSYLSAGRKNVAGWKSCLLFYIAYLHGQGTMKMNSLVVGQSISFGPVLLL